MPKFIDYHAQLPDMPPEMMEQMQASVKEGKADEFGVTPLSIIVGGGQGWCLTEAPNADLICESHIAKGIPQEKGNVTEVTVLG